MASLSSETDHWSEKHFGSHKRIHNRVNDSSEGSSSQDDSDSDSSALSSSSSEYEWREADPVSPPENPKPSAVKIGGRCLPAISRHKEKLVPIKSVLVILFPNNTPEDLEGSIKKLEIKELGKYEAKILTEFLILNAEQDVPKFFVGGEIYVTKIYPGDEACTLLSLKENYETILDHLSRSKHCRNLSVDENNNTCAPNKEPLRPPKLNKGKLLMSFIRPHLALKKKRPVPSKAVCGTNVAPKSVDGRSALVNVCKAVTEKNAKETPTNSKSSPQSSSVDNSTVKNKSKESKSKIEYRADDSNVGKSTVAFSKPRLPHLYPENEEELELDEEEKEDIVLESSSGIGVSDEKTKERKETNPPLKDNSKDDSIDIQDVPVVKDGDKSSKKSSTEDETPFPTIEVDNWLSMVSSELLCKSQSKNNSSNVKISFIQSCAQVEEIPQNNQTSHHDTPNAKGKPENLNDTKKICFDSTSGKETEKSDSFEHISHYRNTFSSTSNVDSSVDTTILGEHQPGGTEMQDVRNKIDFKFTSRKQVLPLNQLLVNELQSNDHPSPPTMPPKELSNLIELFTSLRTSSLNRPTETVFEDSTNIANTLNLQHEPSYANYIFQNEFKSDAEKNFSFRATNSDLEKWKQRSQKYFPSHERKTRESDITTKYADYSSPVDDSNRLGSSGQERDFQRTSSERRSAHRSRSPSTHSRESYGSTHEDSRRNQRSLSPPISRHYYQPQNCCEARDEKISSYSSRGDDLRRRHRQYNREDDYRIPRRKYPPCTNYSKLKFDLPEEIYSPISSSEGDFSDFDEEDNYAVSDRKRVLHTKTFLDKARQRSFDVVRGYERDRVEYRHSVEVGMSEHGSTNTDLPSGTHNHYHFGERSVHSVNVQNVESILPVLPEDIDLLVSSIRRECEKAPSEGPPGGSNSTELKTKRSTDTRKRRSGKRHHSPSIARSLSPSDRLPDSDDVTRSRRRSLSPIRNDRVYDRTVYEKPDVRKDRQYQSSFSCYRPASDRRIITDAGNSALFHPAGLQTFSPSETRCAFYNPQNVKRIGGITDTVSLHADERGQKFHEFERMWADKDKGNRPLRHHNVNSDLSMEEQQFIPEIENAQNCLRSFKPVGRGDKSTVFVGNGVFKGLSSGAHYHQSEWSKNNNANQAANDDDQVVIVLKQNDDENDDLWPFEFDGSSDAESFNEDSCDSEVEALMFNQQTDGFGAPQTVDMNHGLMNMNFVHDAQSIITNIPRQSDPLEQPGMHLNSTTIVAKGSMNGAAEQPGKNSDQVIVEKKDNFDLPTTMDAPDHQTEKRLQDNTMQQDTSFSPNPKDSFTVIELRKSGEMINKEISTINDISRVDPGVSSTDQEYEGLKKVNHLSVKKASKIGSSPHCENSNNSAEEIEESTHSKDSTLSVPGIKHVSLVQKNPTEEITIEKPIEPSTSKHSQPAIAMSILPNVSSNNVQAITPSGNKKEITKLIETPSIISLKTSQPSMVPDSKIVSQNNAKSWKKKLLRKAQETASGGNYDKSKDGQLVPDIDIAGHVVSCAGATVLPENLPKFIACTESSTIVRTAETVQKTESVGDTKKKVSPNLETLISKKPAEVNKVLEKITPNDSNISQNPESKPSEVECNVANTSTNKNETSSSVSQSIYKNTEVVTRSTVSDIASLNSNIVATPAFIDNAVLGQLRKKTVVQGVSSDDTGKLFSKENLNTSITLLSSPGTKTNRGRQKHSGSLASRVNFRGPQMRPKATAKSLNVSIATNHMLTTSSLKTHDVLAYSYPSFTHTEDQNNPAYYQGASSISSLISLTSRVTASTDSRPVSSYEVDSVPAAMMSDIVFNDPFSDQISPDVQKLNSPHSLDRSRISSSCTEAAISSSSTPANISVSNTTKPLKSILRKQTNTTASITFPPLVGSTNGSTIRKHFGKSSKSNQKKTSNLVTFAPGISESNKLSVTTCLPQSAHVINAEVTSSASVTVCQSTPSRPICALAEAVSSIISANPSTPKRKRVKKTESAAALETGKTCKTRKLQPNPKKRGSKPKKVSKGKSGKRKRLPSISSDDDLIEELQASANAEPKGNLSKLVSRENVFTSSEEEESDTDLVAFVNLKDIDITSNKDHSENESITQVIKENPVELNGESQESPKSSNFLESLHETYQEKLSSKYSNYDEKPDKYVEENEVVIAEDDFVGVKNSDKNKWIKITNEKADVEIPKIEDSQLFAIPVTRAQNSVEDVKTDGKSFKNIFSKLTHELEKELINNDLELQKSAKSPQYKDKDNPNEIRSTCETVQTDHKISSKPTHQQATMISKSNTTRPESSTLRVVLSSVETINPQNQSHAQAERTEYQPQNNKVQEDPKATTSMRIPILPTPPISPVANDDQLPSSQEFSSDLPLTVGNSINGPIITATPGSTDDKAKSCKELDAIGKMPEGDSCHGFLEVCMSAPGPRVYALRRIPYVKTTINNESQVRFNDASNAANMPLNSSACATYLRLRDVIFLLKLQPESLWSLIDRAGVHLFHSNSFAKNVFETVYDPVCFSDRAMHKLTLRCKQGEHVQEFLERMILLDALLHAILPKFYSEALQIELLHVPKFVNVKIFKPISNIDEEVIKIFRKPYEYNTVLQSKDDKVKCKTMKRKKISTPKASRKRSGEGACRLTRNKRKKSNEAVPPNLPDFDVIAGSKLQSYPVSFHPQGFFLGIPPNFSQGTPQHPIIFGHNVHRLEFPQNLNQNLNSQFDTAMIRFNHPIFPESHMQQPAALVNAQSEDSNVQSSTELQNQQLSTLPINTVLQIGRPTVIHSVNSQNINRNKIVLKPATHNVPVSSNLTLNNKTMEKKNEKVTPGNSDCLQTPECDSCQMRDVVAEAFVSEVGFSITSVFGRKSDSGLKNGNNTEQCSDTTKTPLENSNAVPDKASTNLLKTKGDADAEISTQQNQDDPKADFKKDAYDISSSPESVCLKGVTSRSSREKGVDNCHLSGVVSKLKARVDAKKKQKDRCRRKGGRAKAGAKKSK